MTLATAIRASAVCCAVCLLLANPVAASGSGPVFQPQTRVGFTAGDQWEPAIAADAFGHVYILFPQYTTTQSPDIPGCPTCPSPTMFLIVSNDNGATWSDPRMIADPGSGQVDVQIKVDPADGKTVYASWLQNNKSLIKVAKSTDFGATWTKHPVTANSTKAGTDKDILVVKGQDVYVGYNHALTMVVRHSLPSR